MIIPNIWENKKCSKPPTRLKWDEPSWADFLPESFFGSHSDGQRPDHFIQRGHFGALLATPCLHPKQNLAGRGGSKQSMLMERANTHPMDWFKGKSTASVYHSALFSLHQIREKICCEHDVLQAFVVQIGLMFSNDFLGFASFRLPRKQRMTKQSAWSREAGTATKMLNMSSSSSIFTSQQRSPEFYPKCTQDQSIVVYQYYTVVRGCYSLWPIYYQDILLRRFGRDPPTSLNPVVNQVLPRAHDPPPSCNLGGSRLVSTV